MTKFTDNLVEQVAIAINFDDMERYRDEPETPQQCWDSILPEYEFHKTNCIREAKVAIKATLGFLVNVNTHEDSECLEYVDVEVLGEEVADVLEELNMENLDA